jgi:hypothetical protein
MPPQMGEAPGRTEPGQALAAEGGRVASQDRRRHGVGALNMPLGVHDQDAYGGALEQISEEGDFLVDILVCGGFAGVAPGGKAAG